MIIRSKIIKTFSENTIILDNGTRVAYLLRGASEPESKIGNTVQIAKRIDLSLYTWTSCTDPGVVKVLSSLFADAINTLDVVITDRLHVGIVAALLGKKLYLLDNSYGKLFGVYEQSMKNFNNVQCLVTINDFLLEEVMNIKQLKADLSLFKTDKTFAEYLKEYSSILMVNDVVYDSIFSY